MSTEITISADLYHQYWVSIRVNDVPLRAQIDTGMTQAACEVGLGLGPIAFDRLAPVLQLPESVEQDVGGPSPLRIPTGVGRVSIEGLDGSEVQTRIARLRDNLLGVCFFHRLHDFELHWDLASRAMTLRRMR